MSRRLEQAFQEAAKLSESEQDSFAEFLLAELQDERDWNVSFTSSPDLLARLADEARIDLAAGRTKPIEDLFK